MAKSSKLLNLLYWIGLILLIILILTFPIILFPIMILSGWGNSKWNREAEAGAN